MLQCNKPIADGAAEPHILIVSIFATLSNRREGTSLLLNMLKAKLHSARHFAVGDKVIIAAFASVEAEKARQHAPTVVLLDDANAIKLPA